LHYKLTRPMWLEQICPDIPMSSGVYTSLVLPSHQQVPITNGRYKLQTLEGFSLKSSEINDFAPLRVTLKHRAVIFGSTSCKCEPLLAFRSGRWLELGSCKRSELGRTCCTTPEVPMTMWLVIYVCKMACGKEALIVLHLSFAAFCIRECQQQGRQAWGPDHALILSKPDPNAHAKTIWKFLDNSMQPQSKVVRPRKGGAMVMRSLVEADATVNSKFWLCPHMKSLQRTGKEPYEV
jgi:hypothetical protein